MSNRPSERSISEVLVRVARWELDPACVPVDVWLFPAFDVDGVEYRLDSLGVLEASLEFQELYGITIPDDVDVTNFITVRSIKSYLDELITESASLDKVEAR